MSKTPINNTNIKADVQKTKKITKNVIISQFWASRMKSALNAHSLCVGPAITVIIVISIVAGLTVFF